MKEVFKAYGYKCFSWQEYFEDSESYFCYPCQSHAKNSTTEKTFIKKELSNWQVAMENGKCFKKHEQTEVYTQAMATLFEREFREKRGQTVQKRFKSGPNIKYG